MEVRNFILGQGVENTCCNPLIFVLYRASKIEVKYGVGLLISYEQHRDIFIISDIISLFI